MTAPSPRPGSTPSLWADGKSRAGGTLVTHFPHGRPGRGQQALWFSPEAGLSWGAPLPEDSQRNTLDCQGLPEGLLLPKVGWGLGRGEARALVPSAVPGLARLPTGALAGPPGPPSPAGHAVSVYKDLGMMSPFLPDLQLFSLMLCCLGGPLWGGPALCPFLPAAVPPTPGLDCSML